MNNITFFNQYMQIWRTYEVLPHFSYLGADVTYCSRILQQTDYCCSKHWLSTCTLLCCSHSRCSLQHRTMCLTKTSQDQRQSLTLVNHLRMDINDLTIHKLWSGSLPVYPNWVHTTLASCAVQRASHIALHWFLKHASTVPSADVAPPSRWTIPRVHTDGV